MSENKRTESAITEIAEEDQNIMEPDSAIQSTLEKLGKEKPETFTEIMAMMGTSPIPNPLHQKMNEEHITQVLDLAANHDKRQYDLHKNSQSNRASENISDRRYTFAAFVILFLLIVVVLVLFKDDPGTLIPVMTGLGGLIGGFFGGWGFGRTRSNDAGS